MVREGFLERMVWKNPQSYGKTHQQGHAWGVTGQRLEVREGLRVKEEDGGCCVLEMGDP